MRVAHICVCVCVCVYQVWYGIGMLYERCGSYEHAEEAFTGCSVLQHVAVCCCELRCNSYERAEEAFSGRSVLQCVVVCCGAARANTKPKRPSPVHYIIMLILVI